MEASASAVLAEVKTEAVGQRGLSKKYTETEGGGETRPEGPTEDEPRSWAEALSETFREGWPSTEGCSSYQRPLNKM